MRQQLDKPILWLKGEVKTPPFSQAARLEAGLLLRRLQRGEVLGLPQSRPMPEIGTHCHELRIPDREHLWRIAYQVADDANRDLGSLQQEDAIDSIASNQSV